MFKPQRLVFKNIPEMAGESSSNWAGIIGRFTKKIEAATENLVIEPINVIGRTAYEDIRNVTEGARGMLNNTLAPLTVMDSDDGFWKKMGKSLLEIPRGMIWGNLKSVGMGVGKLAGTTLGVGLEGKKPKLRSGVGIMGLGSKVLKSGKEIVTSPVGTEPENVMGTAIEDEQESNLSLANWGDAGPKHYSDAA